MDIGESLVGAYLRHRVGCEVVVYNSFFADRRGEIDVVGIKQGRPRTVWLCEVTTHVGGMDLRRGGRTARQVIANKLERLRDFAEATFPGDHHRFEWWSPRVASGLQAAMSVVEQQWEDAGRDLHFITNQTYTDRIRELADDAKGNPSTTNEPAYRMLQVLTRLRNGDFQV